LQGRLVMGGLGREGGSVCFSHGLLNQYADDFRGLLCEPASRAVRPRAARGGRYNEKPV
jgi:hypothetical protein